MTEDSNAGYFRWLHLSDLHVGLSNQDWMWPSLKHLLFDDLKKGACQYRAVGRCNLFG